MSSKVKNPYGEWVEDFDTYKEVKDSNGIVIGLNVDITDSKVINDMLFLYQLRDDSVERAYNEIKFIYFTPTYLNRNILMINMLETLHYLINKHNLTEKNINFINKTKIDKQTFDIFTVKTKNFIHYAINKKWDAFPFRNSNFADRTTQVTVFNSQKPVTQPKLMPIRKQVEPPDDWKLTDFEDDHSRGGKQPTAKSTKTYKKTNYKHKCRDGVERCVWFDKDGKTFCKKRNSTSGKYKYVSTTKA